MLEDVSYSCSDPEVTTQAENLCSFLNFELKTGPFYEALLNQTGLVSPKNFKPLHLKDEIICDEIIYINSKCYLGLSCC